MFTNLPKVAISHKRIPNDHLEIKIKIKINTTNFINYGIKYL